MTDDVSQPVAGTHTWPESERDGIRPTWTDPEPEGQPAPDGQGEPDPVGGQGEPDLLPRTCADPVPDGVRPEYHPALTPESTE